MARQPESSPLLAAILADYDYDAIQTCAGDGSCEIACPVDINTGAFIKHLRHLEHGPRSEAVAASAARHFVKVERGARLAVGMAGGAARVVGHGALRTLTRAARGVVSKDLIPDWSPHMPPAATSLPATRRDGAAAVYFTACVNRIFGRAGDLRKPSLQEAMVDVSARAGMPLWIPEDIGGHCCATIWHSKGYEDGNGIMANRTVESLWRWSDDGKLPIVCDASSCSFGITSEIGPYLSPENRERHAALTILDSIAWAHDRLLPGLSIRRKAGAAVDSPQLLGDSPRSRRKTAGDRRRARRQGGHASVGRMLWFCR